jgi:LPS-assembly protein
MSIFHPRASASIALVLGLWMLLLGSVPAMAQAPVSARLPFMFVADESRYDRELGVIVASGNVEISQGARTLIADSVTYNQKEDLITASGHITMLEPSGEVIFADYLEMSGDFKDGIAHNLSLLLEDETRLAATGARRTGGRLLEMSKGVFSPCKLCAEHPERPPLWQIKAVKIVHDQETRTIEYTDAVIEVAGVPVFYLPFFAHPDPTAEKHSGFLMPDFGTSSNLGFFLQTPYYIDIAPDKDATIEPIFTAEAGIVFAGKYRQRFTRGELQISGSAKDGDKAKSDKNVRGHLFGKARYDINDTWRAGMDVARASDDTYLRRFRFQLGDRLTNESLTTRVFTEGFRGRTYASANAFLFQDLRADRETSQAPIIGPLLDYNFVGNPDGNGAYWSGDANLMVLSRTDGTDSRRISLKGGWNLPYTSPIGDVYALTATVQGDGYSADEVVNQANPSAPKRSGFAGRLFPQIALDWRYPFARTEGQFTQLVEPVVSVVAAKNGGNPSLIPNEDSQDFEFDDTNLFSPNRFTGIDRVEGGQRVNYGLKLGIFGGSGGNSTAFIGHSYRITKDDTFPQGSGVDENFSDIVGRVQIEAKNLWSLLYRYRLDKDNFAPLRSEIDTHIGPPALNLGLNYLFVDSSAGTGGFQDRQEVNGQVASRINRYWSADVNARRDLESKRFIQYGGGVTYEDECTTARIEFRRSFTEDRDIEPTDSVILRIALKTLGGFETSQASPL